MAKTKKMLVIDDVRLNGEVLRADFEREFDVLIGSDGVEGLAAAVTARPDVILLDINMPGMSGIEVMRQLYTRAETCDIPVVVLTGCRFDKDTERQLRPYGNFKGFLSKLDSTDKIRSAVRQALDN
jgi:CheY-like chemotaxis protein